jgi:hypothetical protein
MKFYLDTEFIECAKQRRVLGIKVGPPVPTIDLISIGIVAEDGRALYALNSECELDYAWANEWVRQNVLLPIYKQYVQGDRQIHEPFTLPNLRYWFKLMGFTKAEIGEQIGKFVGLERFDHMPQFGAWRWEKPKGFVKPSFYGYYCDYDWVVMCQLFGSMISLPPGFPMFCIDLKQEIARHGISAEDKQALCPDPVGEHNALIDAQWNKLLHERLRAHFPTTA